MSIQAEIASDCCISVPTLCLEQLVAYYYYYDGGSVSVFVIFDPAQLSSGVSIDVASSGRCITFI